MALEAISRDHLYGLEVGRNRWGTRYTLYLAVGSLRYGGELHHLLVGSLFAGGTVGHDLVLRKLDEGVKLATVEQGGNVLGELYYVEAEALRTLDSELARYGASRRAAVAGFKPLTLHAEVHVLDTSSGSRVAGDDVVRALLALPPLLPPPTQPMTSYPAILKGVRPCHGGEAFCVCPEGSWEAPLVDVVVPLRVLEDWAREVGARLLQVAARTIYGLAVFPLIPVRAELGGSTGGESRALHPRPADTDNNTGAAPRLIHG